jgi:hypothetical protein
MVYEHFNEYTKDFEWYTSISMSITRDFEWYTSISMSIQGILNGIRAFQ